MGRPQEQIVFLNDLSLQRRLRRAQLLVLGRAADDGRRLYEDNPVILVNVVAVSGIKWLGTFLRRILMASACPPRLGFKARPETVELPTGRGSGQRGTAGTSTIGAPLSVTTAHWW